MNHHHNPLTSKNIRISFMIILLACTWLVQAASFKLPTIDAQHTHMHRLVENSLAYLDPKHNLIDPASGYPLEGWNQDPKRGLYLRSFTQLTAIGEWLELMTNIAVGYADNPYILREAALAQAQRISESLLADQNDPNIGAKGLLVNFLGLEGGKRLGPMGRDVTKAEVLKAFGDVQGEKLWQALLEIGWLKPQQQGRLGVIQRGAEYGSEYFEGPLKPFSDDKTKNQVMALLDRRVLQIVFGDNSNLSASVAKSIGALLHPDYRDRPEVIKLRQQLEQFLYAQQAGYHYLYDRKTDSFLFGWNATTDNYFGWDDHLGNWVVGHSDYLVSEFRAPTQFVVLRFGMSDYAIRNTGFKMKSYRMPDNSQRFALAPWSGSAFQALGLSLFMQELKTPAWRTLMQNFVDIELDFAQRHKLPGFLSESYTGNETEYTGEVGLPPLAVTPNPRIIDAPSLYTLGVAYAVRPNKIEAFLEQHWDIISSLFTDHGPWEGYNTTQQASIPFQTTAHTLSLILGALNTGSINMQRYLVEYNLDKDLKDAYRPGPAVSLLSPQTNIQGWTIDGRPITIDRLPGGGLRLQAVQSLEDGGAVMKLPQRVHLANGHLVLTYRANCNLEQVILRLVRAHSDTRAPASIPIELFLCLDKTEKKPQTLRIPLPATSGLRDIQSIELLIQKANEPIDLSMKAFAYEPYPN